MDDFVTKLIAAIIGSAATVIAGCILKWLFDIVVKSLAAGNKKFGLWVQKKRRDRFNNNAADLMKNINDCKTEITKLNTSMIAHLRQDLDIQFKVAMQTKEAIDNIKYCDILDNYIEVGGKIDEKIKGQQRMLALACKGIKNDDDGSLDF